MSRMDKLFLLGPSSAMVLIIFLSFMVEMHRGSIPENAVIAVLMTFVFGVIIGGAIMAPTKDPRFK